MPNLDNEIMQEKLTTQDPFLEMYGGVWGGLIPLVILVGGFLWLSLTETGGIKAFWACTWIALTLGLFFAKDKKEYCKTAIRGISDKTGIIIICAWLFAGVFGKIMSAGGFVSGLLWFGMSIEAQGAIFTFTVFIIAMLFALGTGSGTGTCIALAPVLYPAGYFLASDPGFLAVAILSGAAFGDNLSPISDTTIVSAYTQKAKIRNVVRSRFPLAIVSALITGIILLLFGGDGELQSSSDIQAKMNPMGLFMAIPLAIVIIAALRRRHIIESLVYGSVSAVIIGIFIGTLDISAIFSIPSERGMSTGLIEDGINSVVGAIIFAILILAITQILVESGIMVRILKFAEHTMTSSVRQAELFIIGVTIIASIPISANAPAELLVGKSLVRPVGEKFNLSPARRANLMDCAVCTIFFILPWHIVVAAWYTAILASADSYDIIAPPITVALYNPYSWALLGVLLFSTVTGWGRTYETSIEK